MSSKAARVVTVAVLVLVVAAAPTRAQYGLNFGQNKIQYEDFDWQILETEHFEVYYYPEMRELAEYAGFFAEEAYGELQNRFNFTLNRKVPLIIYSSSRHFQQTNVTPGFIPPGVGGFFEFLKGRVVIPANGDIHRFRRVIRHELVHVFTFTKSQRVIKDHRKSSGRYLPLWFTEGLAEYWSGPPDYQYEVMLRDAVVSNLLVPLDDIHRISGSYQMYKQGEAICRYVGQRYGDEKLLQLIENAWRSKNFREVIEYTLKVDYQTLSDRWHRWMQDEYYSILGDAELPSITSDPVAVEGYSAKPVVHRHENGDRYVYFIGNRTGYTNVYRRPVDSTLTPTGEAQVVIQGGRTQKFEAFHPLESRIDVSEEGRLAFVTKSGGQDVIHVYDLEERAMDASYEFENLVTLYSPSWAPEGRRLVFSAIDEGGFMDLYTYDVADDRLTRLTRDVYDERDPAWHPTEDRITFVSDRTSHGEEPEHAYNLFTMDLDSGQIRYLTHGEHFDFSPRWSPDGRYILFTSSRRDSTGQLGGQNLWVADVTPPGPVATASTSPIAEEAPRAEDAPVLHRLTNYTTAVHDPVWTEDDRLLFTAFEGFSYGVRTRDGLDSLLSRPRWSGRVDAPTDTDRWRYTSITEVDSVRNVPYDREYDLDVAQSQVSHNPVWGTTGGAFVTFSDMLGDDLWYGTVYNTANSTSEFWRSFNAMVARVQRGGRADVTYGAYRFAGLQYDITDPDAAATYPVFWETVHGGFGSVSYPLSRFRRIEVSTSVNLSDKNVFTKDLHRKALLVSNQVSLVHDNALYGMNGPVDGWRANLTAAYTTDIWKSNVNYYSLSLDLRHYWRIAPNVTFASWALGRVNEGREARLWILGGSWDLRGYPLFSVRGQKMWFSSQELRFPLVSRPGRILPVLSPFGIRALRGALFVDAAHAWNDDYSDPNPQLNSGRTLSSAGWGLRLNVFGGFVLRYDVGYRFAGSPSWDERDLFRQFWFGWNF